jgi:hypothetical protein
MTLADQAAVTGHDGQVSSGKPGRPKRRASRAHSRKRPGSAGRRKGAERLARIHARVATVRADALNKATTALAARYETVVVEDLNVAGMIANRRLARAVSDQGFGAEDPAWRPGAPPGNRNPAPLTRVRPGPPPSRRLRRERQQALSRNG